MTANKEFIDGTGLHRGIKCICKFEDKNISYKNETVIFLGTFAHIWGHCITDNIRRIWFLHSLEIKKISENFKIVYVPFYGKELGNNFKELISILGIQKDEIIPINEIIKFKRIILPDECFWTSNDGTRYYTKEYKDLIETIKQYGMNHFKKLKQNKYYFTYAKSARYRQVGERKLERFFKELGYTIIVPEEHSFLENLNILMNCKYFASTIGSCSHNSVFLKTGSFCYLIPRANYLTGYQLALDEVNNDINVTYIDSSLSIYVDQTMPYKGPFYYYVSDNLQKCFALDIKKRQSFRDFKLYRALCFVKNENIGAPEYYSCIAYKEIQAWLNNSVIFKIKRKLKIEEIRILLLNKLMR